MTRQHWQAAIGALLVVIGIFGIADSTDVLTLFIGLAVEMLGLVVLMHAIAE